jgi:hypothetical protein
VPVFSGGKYHHISCEHKINQEIITDQHKPNKIDQVIFRVHFLYQIQSKRDKYETWYRRFYALHANSTQNLKREIKSELYMLFGVSAEHVTLNVMGRSYCKYLKMEY